MKRLALIAIGLFFFQCSTQAAVPAIEREALVSLYNNTNGTKWRNNSNWLSGDPCEDKWFGVTCDLGTNITHIILENNNIAGTIPVETGNLGKLKRLNLRWNHLNGSIPPTLGNLLKLKGLNLYGNRLSGLIPNELGYLVELEWLDLTSNRELSGPIPSEIGNLVNLQILRLGQNQLSGSIPATLGNLVNLYRLELDNNKLSGPVPASLGNLVELETFLIKSNALTGELPRELLNLTSLVEGRKVGFGWNALYTPDDELDTFLDAKTDFDWSSNQTVAPENVTVKSTDEHSLKLAWDTIEYKQHGGRYRVFYSRTPGGPYTDGGETLDKYERTLAVKDLPANSMFYFVVQSETDSHASNSNAVKSDKSMEVSGQTLMAPPGFFVSPSSGLTTTENGGVETFEISLDTRPNADVTVSLSSSDPSEGIISEASLTFTNENWNVPQVVTVTGVDDDEPDGHKFYTIFTGAASSADIDYDGIDPGDISVTNLDDEDFQREALKTLYNSTNGAGWIRKENWFKGDPCLDDWYGVSCDQNANITNIKLWNNRLSGTIPGVLGILDNLQELNLGSNHTLQGSIPTELGNLTKLQDLYLGGNQLSGSIPADLSKLTVLSSLNLEDNQLNGSIPADLGKLMKLRTLNLANNMLSGSIPAELGNLSWLRELKLRENQLIGSIPAELSKLVSLSLLRLTDNKLNGVIPFEIGNLANLSIMDVSGNQLGGTIPHSLGDSTNLRELNLGYNQLSGSIPTTLGNLVKLRVLNFEHNQLSGFIPDELGSLAGLSHLNLSHNQLTGSIPAGLVPLNLIALSLQHNQLSGSIPAGLGPGLWWLWLGSNQLNGPVPASLAESTWFLGNYNLHWNALFTDDKDVDAALDAKSESDWSASQTTAPERVKVSSADLDSVTLAWNPVEYTADDGGYRVWFGTSPGGPYQDGGVTATKSATFHTVSGLEQGLIYYFVVTTETNSHEYNANRVVSDRSAEVTQLLGNPPQPTGINATDGAFTDRVRISFNTIAGATVYRLFRCLDNGQTCGSPIGYPIVGTFDDKNAVPGRVYYYRVKACIANTCGNFSAANTGFAAIQLPQPTGIRASDGTYVDRVHISWNGVDGAGVYRVFRCLDTSQTCGSPIGFPQGTNFDDRKGALGTVYYYRVKACNAQQCSKFSVANAGHIKSGSNTEGNEIKAALLSGQEVPIPVMSALGRWMLILMALGFGLVRLPGFRSR